MMLSKSLVYVDWLEGESARRYRQISITSIRKDQPPVSTVALWLTRSPTYLV